MLRLKDTVRLAQPVPVILLAVERVYTTYGIECVVTSLNDSRHSERSLHYQDKAVDVRIKNVPQPQRNELVARVKRQLGAAFDVVWEGQGTENEHLHIEYDPK